MLFSANHSRVRCRFRRHARIERHGRADVPDRGRPQRSPTGAGKGRRRDGGGRHRSTTSRRGRGGCCAVPGPSCG